jgi:Type VI secretion system effector, Hcp
MPVDVFLKVDGIKGESTESRHRDEIDVLSWSWVCLPLIRAIGSRRPPEVFVMEPTDAWQLHHPALPRRLHTPRLGRVLGQR